MQIDGRKYLVSFGTAISDRKECKRGREKLQQKQQQKIATYNNK